MMQQTDNVKQNATPNARYAGVVLDLEGFRDVVWEKRQAGDTTRAAEIAAVDESTIRRYMAGERPIDTERGQLCLDAFVKAVGERQRREKKAALEAAAAAL